MQDFLKWTLDTIRKDDSMMSWMEEKRFEWVPLASAMLKKIMQAQSVILVTDMQREWFCEYILKSINKSNNNRPLLPFLSLKSLFPNFESIKTKEDIELLENMLAHAFPNGYNFFYIGKGNDSRMQIAKRSDDSFMWVLDEQLQNSFYLSSNDDLLDIKLIQLFRLLDKSIDAVLFAEVSLGNA
ncbi:MAG: HobA family DNA replication regulator [Sulfurospirillum sp.]|nr:HobA family DNA replication regulator [Sulfurospirillum sp.]